MSDRSVPLATSAWSGMESVASSPGLTRTLWLLAAVPPASPTSRTRGRPRHQRALGVAALEGHLDLPHLNRQGQAPLRTHLQARGNGLLDVGQRLILRGALAHATGDRRALDHPRAVLVSVDRYLEPQPGPSPQSGTDVCSAQWLLRTRFAVGLPPSCRGRPAAPRRMTCEVSRRLLANSRVGEWSPLAVWGCTR